MAKEMRVIALLALVSMMGFLGQWFWVFDLFSHFRLQYVIFAVFVAVFFAVKKNWPACAAAVLVMCVNAGEMLPFLSGENAKEISGQSMAIVSFNVNAANKNINDIVKFIKNTDADFVVVQELNEKLSAEIEKNLKNDYPFMLLKPRPDSFGMGVLTRRKSVAFSLEYFQQESWNFYIRTTFSEGARTCELYALHTTPPVSARMSTWRNQYLSEIASTIKSSPTTCKILTGDLNITPYSPWFKELERTSGLRNSMRGQGIQGSWPTFAPVSLLRIPIDHILLSPALQVTQRAVRPAIGSDHFAIGAEIRFK
jgi:endonuclease/exonuclease/phosphatase (EEP) superfamily protein YafD